MPDEKLRYHVPGMHCDHCVRAITAEVESVAGVTTVDVDLEEKTVAVRGAAIDAAAVRQAIAEAGYEAA
jgi:copper chaperone